MAKTSEKLKKQITDAAGNVQYTYAAHWNMISSLKKQYFYIKIAQIALTALTTVVFFTAILAGAPKWSWIGGLISAIALGINLYVLNFNQPDEIKRHTDAANGLWEVREKYKSLIVDFEDIDISEARARRDSLMMEVSKINKTYPGTDDKSFSKARANMDKYKFEDGEAAELLHTECG